MIRPNLPLRPLLAAGLALAAVATVLPGASVTPSATAAPQAANGPLDGHWQTLANGDRITRLLRDGGSEDVLWAATDGGGLVRWDLDRDRYTQYLAPQDGLRSNVVSDIEQTDDGTLWLATERALTRFDPATETAVSYTPDTSPGMPTRVVRALEPAPDGRLWVGLGQVWDRETVDPQSGQQGTFREGGLTRFDPATETWEPHVEHAVIADISNETYETIPSENITDLEYGSDGILWVGTRPYYVWDAGGCEDSDCFDPGGAWVPAGGGLAALFPDGEWQSWRPGDAAASCHTNHVTDLEADDHGRMWVGTGGRGLLLMRAAYRNATCGRNGQPYWRVERQGNNGLRGNFVWSVDIDDEGRVWLGQGNGHGGGLGLAILDHKGTFDDSTGAKRPWEGDDVWTYADLDNKAGKHDALVTALLVDGDGPVYLGTRDHKRGDGVGLRRFELETRRWEVLTTAADGLPSNHITAIARHPANGDLWFSFRHRGVARFDGQAWQWWRTFQDRGQVTTVASALPDRRRGYQRVPVALEDEAAFDAAFPGRPAYARIGDDRTLYRILGFVHNSAGSYIDITPDVETGLEAGTAVYAVDRGPPSNSATQIAFDDAGRVWVGGRETVWQSGFTRTTICDTFPDCWADGGLGMWDGRGWTVYDLRNSEVPDQEVQSVLVDRAGRVWAGTGHPREAEGDGIGVLDPDAGSWTRYDRETLGTDIGGDGTTDFDIDSQGRIWMTHHPSLICAKNSPFGDACAPLHRGGGVSMFDGARWQTWSKTNGASLRAFGEGGELGSVLVDEGRQRVWAGGFDGEKKSLHWTSGQGIDAVVNWCPLDCTADGWQHQTWPDDGQVAALALDAEGQLWAGTHRSGNGLTPPVAGVKLLADGAWHTYTPDSSDLVSNEITALTADGDLMWVGTLRDGVSRYSPQALPTPTPRPSPTRTPPPTPTSEIFEPTPTPGPSPTRGAGALGCDGRWCRLYVPFAEQRVR